MSLFKYRAAILALLASALSQAACTYSGGIDNPIARKLNWFSYVAGDDIKAKCTPTAPTQYRLVYNANWDEQVRAYDFRQSLIKDGGAMLFSQIFGGATNVSSFSLTDPLGPARGVSGEVRLTQDQFLAISHAIDDSGFGQPSPAGLRLESWDFYWVVSACVAGQFHFNAWLYPSARYDGIRFDQLLFAADGTGVAVNPPRRMNAAEQRIDEQFPRYRSYGGTPYTFELVVGDNGLAGRLPPL